MANVTVFNQNNEQVGELELDDSVFGADVKDHLLHAVVRKQLAARRQGTHAVKRRADVSGGGKKPFKQKGTGRARQGTTRAPHMRGGGRVFGPEPRSYDFKINKKEMASALRSALSKRVAEGKLTVIDSLSFEQPKTSAFVGMMKNFGLGTTLVVMDDVGVNVDLSARNVQKVTVIPADGLNVYDILKRSDLVLTRAAVDAITARLGGAK